MTNEQFYNTILAAKRLMVDDKGKPVVDKLSYACKRYLEKNKALADELENKLRDAETAHCSTDDRGNILFDEQGRLMFTIEAEKKVKAEKKALFAETITPEVSICTDKARVVTLHPDYEILNGVVFHHNFWEGAE